MIKSALKTGREMIYLDIYIFIYLRETMVVRLFNELMIFFFFDFSLITESYLNVRRMQKQER